MSDFQYFSYCPVDGLEFHKAIEEAKQTASENIKNYLDGDGWGLDVEYVCYGEIKGIATEINVKTDETGKFDYICEYELKQPD